MTERPLSIRGVVPALVTPFKADHSIDERSLQRLAASIAAKDGVSAIFCTGHAGELTSLSLEEQLRVVSLVREAVGPEVTLLAGINTNDQELAVDCALAVKRAGASALTVFPPPTFADAGTVLPDIVYSFFEAIAQGSDVPIVVFQYPLSSGLAYNTETLVRLATLPQVVGVKEGSEDLPLFEANLRALRAANPPVSVLTSNNNFLLGSLAVGGDGIISGSGSLVAELHVALWRAIEAGRLADARHIHERLHPLVQVIYRRPAVHMHTRIKEALRQLDVIPSGTVRPPLVPLERVERKIIRDALVRAGML